MKGDDGDNCSDERAEDASTETTGAVAKVRLALSAPHLDVATEGLMYRSYHVCAIRPFVQAAGTDILRVDAVATRRLATRALLMENFVALLQHTCWGLFICIPVLIALEAICGGQAGQEHQRTQPTGGPGLHHG
jgi:hypothetical protein